MFGMGFTEILIIGIIAILFLGPDKLPQTMVEIAKFFKNVKRTLSDAKESIDEELHLQEIKEQALGYKEELTSASNELSKLTDIDDIKEEVSELKEASKVSLNDIENEEKVVKQEPEEVTFKKKKKKKKKIAYADEEKKSIQFPSSEGAPLQEDSTAQELTSEEKPAKSENV